MHSEWGIMHVVEWLESFQYFQDADYRKGYLFWY